MTEFKQDNFTFVDIISLIFIFFLSTANFFALLYLTDGKMPISLAITVLVLVIYYAIMQVLKNKKQAMASKNYKSAATLWFLPFIGLSLFSLVLLVHFLNIENNVKPKVQAEVNEKINKVIGISTIYEEKASKDLQNYKSALTKKLRAYVKNRKSGKKYKGSTQDSLQIGKYVIDNQTLAIATLANLSSIVESNLSPIRNKVSENTKILKEVEAEAERRREDFQNWNFLGVAKNYNTTNDFVTDSYKLLNEKLEELPMHQDMVLFQMDSHQLPLNSFSELNKVYPPNWFLPILIVVVIHLVILIPFITYKVRRYDNESTPSSIGGATEY